MFYGKSPFFMGKPTISMAKMAMFRGSLTGDPRPPTSATARHGLRQPQPAELAERPRKVLSQVMGPASAISPVVAMLTGGIYHGYIIYG